jgi:cyclopropane-fatty-acyl-phospholipid synthase
LSYLEDVEKTAAPASDTKAAADGKANPGIRVTKQSKISQTLAPLFTGMFEQGLPVPIQFWDGSQIGPDDAPGRVVIKSANALRRILYRPNLLGFSRAFAADEIDIEGDVVEALYALYKATPQWPNITVREATRLVSSVVPFGVLGRPLAPPPEEAPSHWRRHTRLADSESIHHHYDISNEFYALFLGPTMAYTCARYESAEMSLDDAQVSKFDLVCRKVGLKPGDTFLDVGCGWGGLAMHAAEHYGANVVAVNVSKEQAQWAQRAIEARGLSKQIDVRNRDYRTALRPNERFDAVAAVGILEHVGAKNTDQFFATYANKLKPGGRMLNHAISKSNGTKTNAFIDRYIFPDGELQHPGAVVYSMERAGLEVRDLESLREHYEKTCRAWIANLESNWDEAVKLVGANKTRLWRMYLAGSAIFFRDNGISLHQVLGVKTTEDGYSGMPWTRRSYV